MTTEQRAPDVVANKQEAIVLRCKLDGIITDENSNTLEGKSLLEVVDALLKDSSPDLDENYTNLLYLRRIALAGAK